MTTQALTRYDMDVTGLDLFKLGSVFARSGYFRDARDEAQAIVKILAGRELGIGPMASMLGIHIIDGKPSLSSRLMAGLIKKSGRYSYAVKTATETECVIQFFEGTESLGIASFTQKEAQQAGLSGKDNWKKYPKAMLFARAMSQGFTMYTPDLSNGMPVYTPDELGAETDEAGEPVPLRPIRIVDVGPEPNVEPKLPHPDAEDTGERYQGEIVWRVDEVLCLAKEKRDGGRYLQSTITCPKHERPYYLSPDGDPGDWAHGTGEGRCEMADDYPAEEDEDDDL